MKGKNAENVSFFFTQYVTEGRSAKRNEPDDPREALLQYDTKAKQDPIFFGKAYAKTQPKVELGNRTIEEEREEFNAKKQRRV